MDFKKWTIRYLGTLAVLAAVVAGIVWYIDPLFHYHKPLPFLHYAINSERSQNDGILRNFDYELIITGTSMTENFKTSDAESLFGMKAVKVPYSGAPFGYVDEALRRSLKRRPGTKIVIRSIDATMLFEDAKDMIGGDYEDPTWLYDDNPFNDVKYLFNKKVLMERIYQMLRDYRAGKAGGIDSFDEAYNWMWEAHFGGTWVIPEGKVFPAPKELEELSQEDKDYLQYNIREHFCAAAAENPDITFYYFFPPYSIAWWGDIYSEGQLHRQVEAHRIVIDEMLKYDNIRVFGFNDLFEITTEIDNYYGDTHYGEEINTLLLEHMAEGESEITEENVEKYCEQLERFYGMFPY